MRSHRSRKERGEVPGFVRKRDAWIELRALRHAEYHCIDIIGRYSIVVLLSVLLVPILA